MKIREEIFCSILTRLRSQYEFETKIEREIRDYRERTKTDGLISNGIFNDDNLEMLVKLLDEVYRYRLSKLVVLGIRIWQEI